MGASEFTSASKEDVELYFQKEWFQVSESLDISKFRAFIYNEWNYVAYQKYLEGLYNEGGYKLAEIANASK